MLPKMQHYLEVIVVLAQKDFKVRYRNSVLGFIWSILNPLGYMLILTIVFSFLLRMNIPNYSAWVLIGILIWRFFSIGTSQGLSSIVANASLVTKLYMPRYLIVLSNTVANLLGIALEVIVLLPLLAVFGVHFTVYALLLPVVLVLESLFVFGLSLLLSSINLKYRDFQQLWDIALQLGFFLSPIIYDVTLVPSRYRLIYSLNPVTRLIESARDMLLFGSAPSLWDFLVVVSGLLIFLLIGFLVFQRLEGHFAEEL